MEVFYFGELSLTHQDDTCILLILDLFLVHIFHFVFLFIRTWFEMKIFGTNGGRKCRLFLGIDALANYSESVFGRLLKGETLFSIMKRKKKKKEKRGEIKTLLTVIIFLQLIASNLLGELEFDFK